ncbi:MAG: hypothetical protein RXR20_31150 [Paraburkholderia sp.]|jgi:hypothetical protein|uniref:hypothetical protein n=1 Tax=Burkholderiaceae TaxID=119060 RepID=UPI001485140B|nr:hypothetical protein [Burkholderia sp. 4M9327F10]
MQVRKLLAAFTVAGLSCAAGDAQTAEIAELDEASSTKSQMPIVTGIKHSF